MTLLERMDRLVYATRIDRILFRKSEPRAFRWIPALVIAGLIGGYVIMVKAGGVTVSAFFAGWLIFYGAFLAAACLRALGPRFTPSVDRPLDERELMVKAQAHAVSGVVLAMAAMLGCFYMTSEGAPWLWHPHGLDWFHLGFGVQAVSLLLPTWIASWIAPRPVDLED